MTTPTLAERLAEVLLCAGVPECVYDDCDPDPKYWTHSEYCPARHSAVVLALIDELIAEEREACANEPFEELRADALNPQSTPEAMLRWNVRAPGALWMRDAIRARRGETT